MEKIITYFGQEAKVACDEQCNKAWGSERPFIQCSDDIDDIVWLSDSELGEAPQDNGHYENDESKPKKGDKIPNRWCVRECERCAMSNPGEHNEPLKLPDFSKRVYNMPYRHNVK